MNQQLQQLKQWSEEQLSHLALNVRAAVRSNNPSSTKERLEELLRTMDDFGKDIQNKFAELDASQERAITAPIPASYNKSPY